MQYITSLSKYLIPLVISLILVLAWNGGNTPVKGFETAYIESTTEAKTGESIWTSISKGFVLDHETQSAKVQTEIKRLLANQEELYRILQAAAPYIYFIHQQTRAYGLPAEIALIPFIESEYNPNDRSNKGALGLWQLMRGTAHDLGVKVKAGYDGRRNVIDSTNAALTYFRDLGNKFDGNWYLAIAAYNCGDGKVQSAVRRTGSKNFWNLPLPKETKYYVPRLLAVAAIIEDPEKYGVELPPISNEPYFTEVKIQKPVNLVKVAKSTGINTKTLHALNPDNKHGTVSEEKPLLVPLEKVPVVKSQLRKENLLAKA